MAASPAPSTGALTAGRTLPAEGMAGPMKTRRDYLRLGLTGSERRKSSAPTLPRPPKWALGQRGSTLVLPWTLSGLEPRRAGL